MPVVRKMEAGLWEIRIQLDNRIARVFFTLEDNVMVLLHGFIKKDQKTPQKDLDMARKRMAVLRAKS